jgi:hypothetical protein
MAQIGHRSRTLEPHPKADSPYVNDQVGPYSHHRQEEGRRGSRLTEKVRDQAINFAEVSHDSARLAEIQIVRKSFWSKRGARHAKESLSVEKGKPCQNVLVPMNPARFQYFGKSKERRLSFRASALGATLPPKQAEPDT